MATTDLTWSDIRHDVAALCEERGWHHGIPMMSATDTTRDLVLAKGCPLSDKYGHDVPVPMDGLPRVHICTNQDIDDAETGPYVVNMWKMDATEVYVLRSGGKAKVYRINASRDRLEMLMKSMICQAGAVDSDTELKAMVALKQRINDNQWDAYILGGGFPETSKRSGVTYILRKGLPTIAIRCMPQEGGGEKRHFLAALCSHPLGWYSGTHVGCYPPSDEVLANLLSIRADEHSFWRKSNQHGLTDPLAGI